MHTPIPPLHHPDLPLPSTSTTTSLSALHLPTLPPPSYYHLAVMPPLPPIHSPAFRPYFPLQPTTQSGSNDSQSTVPFSLSTHSQQYNFSTIQPSQFYSQ